MSETSHHDLHNFDPASDLAAAKAWWELAGVDCAFADDATVWLAPVEAAEPEARAKKQAMAQAAAGPKEPATALERALAKQPDQQIAATADGLPGDLAAFQKFWMEDASLAAIAPTRRVAPMGPGQAELMVLVAQPDQQDEQQLLEGPQGQVLSAILRAMKIDVTDTYRAAVLPSCMAMPDWQALAAQGLGTLTQHHIRLAAPRRVVIFGRALEHLFAIDNADLPPTMIAPSLDNLARSAGRRQRFWNQWLDWTA